MRVVRTVSEVRAVVAEARAAGRKVGLVPTMGSLHEGHCSLLRRAASECDEVVMSLFVNPAQFRAGEDLDAYPRDEERDAAVASEAGATTLFAPPVTEVYPDGFATTVTVRGAISETLCGAARGAEHFQGVATVVTKLLNMVSPDVAYFGQKDAQQTLVIRRLVRDLDIPVQIEICPTVREADGLAASSRNTYLDAAERERAIGLSRALLAAEHAVAGGEHEAARIRALAHSELAAHGIEPEYLELRSPETLEEVDEVDGPVLVAVAARVGSTRLIDNAVIAPRR